MKKEWGKLSKISNLKKSSNPYFIAEIGFNHLGNYNLAVKMIKAAKKSNADAVKFQTYVPEEMVFKNTQHYRIIKNTALKFKEYLKLKSFCNKLNLDFITTPFDIQSIKICKKINFDAIKIASMDLNNPLLISEVVKLKKPIIISTGMSSIREIQRSLKQIKNKKNLFLLHCVSNYPTRDAQSDLYFLKKLKKIHDWKIGFSDHTSGDFSTIGAISVGAKIIEKHFTCNNKIKGADNKMSYNSKSLKHLILKSREIYSSFLDKTKRSDIKNRNKMRRFFFFSKDLTENHTLKNEDLKFLRCKKYSSKLLSVDNYKKIINKKLTKNVSKDQVLTLGLTK